MALKEEQRLEYEEAMRKDLEKIEQKKIQEEEKKEEELKLQKEKDKIEAKIEENKNKLKEEPEEGNPEAATIQIRLADGNSVTRRFLKTSSIEEIYIYIRSLGEDAGLEEITNDFELFQQNNKYTDFSKTIADEGLFPRSKIYCREL